jgi:hypothetical protein
MHEERIFKHKFIYFYSIIFLFGYTFYYGVIIVKFFFRKYRLDEVLGWNRIPIYLLFFLTFICLILSLINIFKESYKSIFYFNIAVILITITLFLNAYFNKLFEKPYSILAITVYLLLLSFSVFLINFYKHKPIVSEIEDLGKPE